MPKTHQKTNRKACPTIPAPNIHLKARSTTLDTQISPIGRGTRERLNAS